MCSSSICHPTKVLHSHERSKSLLFIHQLDPGSSKIWVCITNKQRSSFACRICCCTIVTYAVLLLVAFMPVSMSHYEFDSQPKNSFTVYDLCLPLQDQARNRTECREFSGSYNLGRPTVWKIRYRDKIGEWISCGFFFFFLIKNKKINARNQCQLWSNSVICLCG